MWVHVKSCVIHSEQTGKVFTSYAMKASVGKRVRVPLDTSSKLSLDAPTDFPPAKYSYAHQTGYSVDSETIQTASRKKHQRSTSQRTVIEKQPRLLQSNHILIFNTRYF